MGLGSGGRSGILRRFAAICRKDSPEGRPDFFPSFSGLKRLTIPQEKIWTDLTGIDLYWVADEVGGRTRQSFALQAGLYLLLVEYFTTDSSYSTCPPFCLSSEKEQ